MNAQNPVKLELTVQPERIAAGGNGTANVSASIEDGWYIYSLTQAAGGPVPTQITFESRDFTIKSTTGPKPKKAFDANFNIETEKYSGNVVFVIPFSVSRGAINGANDLVVKIRYQACNDTVCLPPKTIKLQSQINITGGSASSENPVPETNANVKSQPISGNLKTINPDSEGQTRISEATQIFERENSDQPIWGFIWLAMTFGALSLLTPCVFPMIPITVSYFTKHSADTHLGSVRDALIYTFGIILTFTGLGIALSLLFGAAGINRFAANPWINLLIAGIFLAFAFSLLGAYDLGIPSSVLTKLDALTRTKSSSRTIGLLLMGLTFSLTSFTCTAPLVGTILVASSQGKLIYPIIGMLAFSVVFAMPFFVLAIAPRFLHSLPRSGDWMNSVKVVMGFLEIGAAIKFISNADLIWSWGFFSREIVIAAWTALSILVFLYLLGIFRTPNDPAERRVGLVRILNSFLFVALSVYLFTGILGRGLGEIESFLPPMNRENVAASDGELTWITNDYSAALKEAKEQNKNIFIDFTGYTCTNCRWMEANMFTRPEVRSELGKFVRLRLYTDGAGEPFEGFQKLQEERFGTVALPLYAIVSPEDVIRAKFVGLTRNSEEFVNFLRH